MKDTFKWNRETINEFFDSFPDDDLVTLVQRMEQFKYSKAPKKEWEIVAYRVRKNKIYYTANSDGRGRIWDSQEKNGGYICQTDLSHPDVEIFSVRRLPDGEIVSLTDKTANGFVKQFKIGVCENGVMDNSQMYVSCVARIGDDTPCAGLSLRRIQKLPDPVLTTVDGVEIYKDQKYWVVESMEEGYIPEYYANENNKTLRGPAFSTREAAEHYILNNRPLLSLNDVKKICQHSDQAKALSELTTLVKQRLNQ